VLKIFGPGNAYVVEAKRQVFGQVAIDLLPGPSEILVLADATANPAWIAADLLAQAEHGKNSSILFVTNSAKQLKAVQAQIAKQLATLRPQEHLASVLEKDCALILVKSLQDAVAVANDFAPEHISIVAAEEDVLAAQIRTSGAIFLGGFSPVAAGDFLAGPSHTLPTGGAGKSFPGLTVDQFQRRTSIVRPGRKIASQVRADDQHLQRTRRSRRAWPQRHDSPGAVAHFTRSRSHFGAAVTSESC
jgi:histidinol dehydrogenase